MGESRIERIQRLFLSASEIPGFDVAGTGLVQNARHWNRALAARLDAECVEEATASTRLDFDSK